MSKIIPNSFQTPNLYIDQLMPFLLDSELRVLLYVTRRTLGFLKRQDRISLSQLVNGIVADGEQLDYGAGVSESSAKTALRSLVELGVLLQTAPVIAAKSLPPEWEPQWDETKIKWETLRTRHEEKKSNDKVRLAKRRASTPPPIQQGEGISNNPGAVQQGEGGAVQQGEGGAVQQPPQKPVETQLETQGGNIPIQDQPASQPAPLPPLLTNPSAEATVLGQPAITAPAIASTPIPVSTPTPPVAAPLPAPIRPALGVLGAGTGDPLMDQATARFKGQWGGNREQHHLDELQRQVAAIGLTAEAFRQLVDACLEKYGMAAVAALSTDDGVRALTRAQTTMLAICTIDERFRSVAGLESIFVSWRENDYRGESLPNSTQLIEHAGKMKAGAVASEAKKGQVSHGSTNAVHRNGGGRPQSPSRPTQPKPAPALVFKRRDPTDPAKPF